MDSSCEKCENFLTSEAKRVKWFNTLSKENVTLYHEIVEQAETIKYLKAALAEKCDTETTPEEYMPPTAINVDRHEPGFRHMGPLTVMEDVLRNLRLKINDDHVSDSVRIHRDCVNQEVLFLQAKLDFYRDCMFDTMAEINELRNDYLSKCNQVLRLNNQMMLHCNKNEENKIIRDLRQRHQAQVVRFQADLEIKTVIISKLKMHNRQMYEVNIQLKRDQEEKMKQQEMEIAELKNRIKTIKEKNDGFYTQLKLAITGCHTDIKQAKKKLLGLLNTWNKTV